jgi:N-acetyl-gamma-glutamyl-phosphate reductase
MIKVAIIGATGYTGIDAIEIILRHQQAELTYLTASSDKSVAVESVHPRLSGRCDLDIEPLDFDKLASVADVALCCLPHKVSMGFVPRMLERGVKVVDFSADYRIKDVAVYEKHYVTHTDTANIERAVYGLPELYRERIRGAELVANPGCFPTTSSLGLAPLLKYGYISGKGIVVNSVSGATGAGKKLADGLHFPNLNENLRAYGVGTHRHMPEMEQIAAEIAEKPVSILFQPHIGCFDRGILSSIYCDPREHITSAEILELYRNFYRDEPFVQILSEPPSVKNVANTNYCHIYPATVKGKLVIFSAIDNLVKGASGQAVQNMNIMFGVDERMGLL